MKVITSLRIFTLIGLMISQWNGFTQSNLLDEVDLSYYLPETEYDENIPSPKEFLGYEIGEWYVNHDRQLAYMELLAELSDRVTITKYAETYERRQLAYLTITSEKNQGRIDEILENHKKLSDPYSNEKVDVTNMPLVLYQGYSIHGDEASGGNAALLVAYYLAAGKSEQVKKTLDNLVILFDPCYNPDGFQRYASWVNSTRDMMFVTDPNDINHNEPWPTGRTNHYWFDLNRDWLLLTHPESQGRIDVFQKWNPNVLTDHHEMGKNSTFFFQPGVPSRTNPLTPQINQDITEGIADYHGQHLDSIGAAYFSKERFDDFYYGKGSTYPDGQGCIGILFEQATSEGILQETDNGLLSWPFSIRNQVVTSLSTHKACVEMRDSILLYQHDFYKERLAKSKKKDRYGYIINIPDLWKRERFKNIVESHKIIISQNTENIEVDGKKFPAKSSLIIGSDQRQTTLIESIFEERTSFTDSIFYDVSTWNFPHAFNADFAEIPRNVSLNLGESIVAPKTNRFNKEAYHCVIPWSNYMAPSLAYQLTNNGILVERATKDIADDYLNINAGDLILDLPKMESSNSALLRKLIKENDIEAKYINKSIQELKSNHIDTIQQISLALITGEGTNAYEVGDNYFQLDYRWKIPVTKFDINQLGRSNLDRYTHIIFADGRYSFDEVVNNKLNEWIEKGGTLILMRRAIQIAENANWISLENKSDNDPKSLKDSGGQVIGGAIFNTKIDLNDPLMFGYKSDNLPIFKKGTQWYQTPLSPAIKTVGSYTENPLLCGYASIHNKEKSSNSTSVMRMSKGEGNLIMLVDNPNFRGFWYGGSTLFANCIFFK